LDGIRSLTITSPNRILPFDFLGGAGEDEKEDAGEGEIKVFHIAKFKNKGRFFGVKTRGSTGKIYTRIMLGEIELFEG
jgi:hypothetical protein